MSALSIDVGGTSFKVAIVKDGAILTQDRLPHSSERADLDRLAEFCQNMIGRVAAEDMPTSVGMSLPGIIDQELGGMVSAYDKVGYMLDVDLRGWLRDTFSLPAAVENDGRAALWGEVGYGVARGKRDVVVMTFGTGIGTGALIDGVALHGPHEHGAILGGHQQVNPFAGRLCTCGARGCLEAEAGGWSMPAIVKQWPAVSESALAGTSGTFSDVAQAAYDGDAVARAIVEHCARVWAVGIVNLVHILDPEMVVLTGGLMNASDLVIDTIREEVNQRIWATWGRPEITVAADVYASATLGMAYLAEVAGQQKIKDSE
ncbi:ROK family protein [Haematomicrobium sanguinis]|uniref:ROK family protein n=1 Tax=Haematomicrobium sanguinis TaxID=479106 RepID=UPI00047B24A1|nr:ROK family protein [Haematomicrobium sanguinis]